jgi:hypothetical protein
VVDLDLENFFNRVNHQRLMSRLAQRVQDKRLLELIGGMLKAKVVLPDGVKVSNDEGVPQGGPLSPLLSNVVLDELDWKLQERGHRFVRYADDANIYVKSPRAGQRVMASVKAFIERRLRLKVNADKSAVAQPQDRHFLGFSLKREPKDEQVQVHLSGRSKERIDGSVSGMFNKQEVQIHTWGPGKGNPTPRRQVQCCGGPRLDQRDAKRWEAREGLCGRSRRCVNLTNESEAP